MISVRSLLIIFAATFCAAAAHAVDTLQVSASDPILTPANWSRFDGKSGVAGRLRGFAPEPDGKRFWLATLNGLQYYDGLVWTTWTADEGLAQTEVEDVKLAPDGSIWVAFPDSGIAHSRNCSSPPPVPCGGAMRMPDTGPPRRSSRVSTEKHG